MSIGLGSAEGVGRLAIHAKSLVYLFGDNVAVDSVDLKVAPGKIYDFLGPNGAGKTTTIRMLATLLRPGSDTAWVSGYDVVRSALSSSKRPRCPSALSASRTFGWRALLKIKHVPEQLFGVTAFPIVFTLMFTYLFGGALAGSIGEYLQFLLPGILVQTVVFIMIYTGFTLNGDITKGSLDRFRSLPVWRPAVLVGALLGDVARYAMASTIVVVLGFILGFRPAGGIVDVLLSVALLLVFSFSLLWIWTAIGLILRMPNSVMGVSMMVLFPLTFASNIFVGPPTMPWRLEAIVTASPITYLVTAARGLMHGTATAGQIGGWVLLVSSRALIAVFAPLTMYLYRNKK